MATTLRSKTVSASLSRNSEQLYAWISDPENLPRWHGSFCRSLRREAGGLIVDSPRGPVLLRLIRDDRSFVLDLEVTLKEGLQLVTAVRVLANGEGSEIVMTLVQPHGLPDALFHEQVRWLENAARQLRKAPAVLPGTPEHSVEPAPAATEGRPESDASDAAEPSVPTTGKKLFIGNLPFDWTDEQLRGQFAAHGEVLLAEIARFRRGGRSRGFGFVEMSTEEQAQAAIDLLHETLAGTRKVIVRRARSQESRPSAEKAPAAEAAPPEPGNRREPDIESEPQPGNEARPSSQAPRVSRLHREGRSRALRPTRRPRVEIGIVNNSGYEIFPLRGPRKAEPASDVPEAPPSRVEQSPYFDDTGDVENRPHRPPRRRRR